MTLNEKNLKKTLSKFNQIFVDFQDTMKRLAETHEFVSYEDFFTINDTEFNISFCFDDLCESKDYKGSFWVANLCFAIIEDSNEDILFLKRNYPSFYKLQAKMEELIGNQDSWCAIGKDCLKLKEEDVDEATGFTFETLEDFNKELKKWEECSVLLKSFLNEVIKYCGSVKYFNIDDTGIVEVHSNNGKKQNVLFKTKKHLYKIDILSESYDFQSYARLSVKDEKGFTVLKSANTKRDYGIDLTYKKDYSQDSFREIIKEFKELAIKTEI